MTTAQTRGRPVSGWGRSPKSGVWRPETGDRRPEGGRRCRGDRAFTLVEMLVVMAIIAILAGLLIPTIASAVKSARASAIALELDNLAQAMEAYKAKYHDYPPDFTNPQAVVAHMKKAYPRSTVNVVAWLSPASTLTPKPADLDPAEAIVFWLREVSTNPRNPLSMSGESVNFFDFDETRFVDLDGDGWKEYVPKYAQGAPYVYFDGRELNGKYIYDGASYGGGSMGVVRPFRSNIAIDARDNGRTQPNTAPNNTKWVDAGKFQIISAGMDNEYGSDTLPLFRKFPQPDPNEPPDNRDNLTSFSEGRTIGDSIP